MSTPPDATTDSRDLQPVDEHDTPEKKTMLRRVAFASFMGSLIEAYDFALYGFAAAIVFPHVFFPTLGGASGTIASVATLGVAFVVRPIGAVIFGHLGDRLGRKSTLVITVLGMGIGTALIGLLPPASAIGVLAPILLVILRAVQGLAIGGEWAGAVLFASEHAPPNRRGLYAMFPQLGATVATVMSGGMFLLVGVFVDPDTFIAWGWRVPFVGSLVLVFLALYIRLRVTETPAFEQEQARNQSRSDSPPLFEAFRRQPKVILRGAGVALTTVSFVYVAQSFLSGYGVNDLNFTNNAVFAAITVSGIFYAGGTVVSGILSDHIGRRVMISGAQIMGAIWALALFPVLNMATMVSYTTALCITMGIAGLAYGAVGAFLPEQFPTRYRYTAAGVSYQITGVIGGGIVPLLAPTIVSASSATTFGVFLAVLSGFAAVCTLSLRDMRDESMDWTPSIKKV